MFFTVSFNSPNKRLRFSTHISDSCYQFLSTLNCNVERISWFESGSGTGPELATMTFLRRHSHQTAWWKCIGLQFPVRGTRSHPLYRSRKGTVLASPDLHLGRIYQRFMPTQFRASKIKSMEHRNIACDDEEIYTHSKALLLPHDILSKTN